MELKITFNEFKSEYKKLIDLNKRLEHKKLQDTIRFIIKTYKLE